MSLLYTIALIVLLLMGLTFLPVMSYMLRDSIPSGLAEFMVYIHLALVNFGWGGMALVERGFGYDLLPLRVREAATDEERDEHGDKVIEVKLSGEWTAVDATVADIDSWAFGLFTMLVERGDHLSIWEAPDYEDTVVGDGGEDVADGVLLERRGGHGPDDGYKMFDPTRAKDTIVAKADGPTIDLGRVYTALKAVNMEGPIATGHEKATLEHGSRITKGGNLVTIVGVIITLVLGMATVLLPMVFA